MFFEIHHRHFCHNQVVSLTLTDLQSLGLYSKPDWIEFQCLSGLLNYCELASFTIHPYNQMYNLF
jgi:hypothetical protein